LKLLFNISLFLVCTISFAQTEPKPAPTDSVRNRFLPTGIRIGTDIIALVKTNVQDDFNGWEVNADVDFSRYYLAVDYGRWARNYPGDLIDYSNVGNYWRAGVDVNFLTKDVERNMFFIGARYGRSNFTEDLAIITTDPVWGDLSQTYQNKDISARWLELTTGVRVKIWQSLWMGYTARFKFGMKANGAEVMLPHDVPGYGRTDRQTTWGFNYQIFMRIPFRKTPPLPPAKKKK
jgi:hypothetical protein